VVWGGATISTKSTSRPFSAPPMHEANVSAAPNESFGSDSFAHAGGGGGPGSFVPPLLVPPLLDDEDEDDEDEDEDDEPGAPLELLLADPGSADADDGSVGAS
jgi:hypothetical protein